MSTQASSPKSILNRRMFHRFAMDKKSSLALMCVGLIPCLLAINGFMGFNLHGKPRDVIANNFPQAALPTQSGYVVVNASSQSRMFYAFYEALDPEGSLQDVPIILWLQGGPGCSSMTGNFYEFGPWQIGSDMQLRKNNYTWNVRYALLFVDNPVGTGFSIAEKDDDIPRDQEHVAVHLFSLLTQFFQMNSKFQSRPFFVGGESYGGKHVPALGYYIMRGSDPISTLLRSEHHKVSFRLDGLLIGNGLTHPVVQVRTHGDTAYNFGLIDRMQKDHVDQLAEEVIALIEKEDWQCAYTARTALVDWITDVTGLATPLDVRRSVPYHCTNDGSDFLENFLNQKKVKEALSVEEGSQWVSCNPRVRAAMASDMMRSVRWMVDELLPHIPILFYQGMFDIKDGVACNEEWKSTLTWEGTRSYLATPRTIWRVNDAVAGYWRTHKTLSHVVVLGAGHLVPADQGLHSQKMIETWIEQRSSQVSTL